MHAWLCENPVGVDAISWKELPTPTPKAGEVLIEIKAAVTQRERPSTSRLFDFSMRVSIKRPQAPVEGASAPAAKAAPAGAKAS